MHVEETPGRRGIFLRRSGLRVRMTVSYALMTLVVVLLIEILIGSTIYLLLAYGPLADDGFVSGARQTARQYALAASVQAEGGVLNPRTTFEPGQPASIALPDEGSSDPASGDSVTYVSTNVSSSQVTRFALLISQDGRVLSSSYPTHYSVATLATQLLPDKSHLIMNALAGIPGSAISITWQGRIVSAAETVWSRDKKPIGAVYLQTPELPSLGLLGGFAKVWFFSGLFWLLIMLPVGALFGLVTTRGLIRRLQYLVTATTRFADGDYMQRVPISRPDEVGQLEAQFNRMAGQLAESMTRQQALAEGNARMAERNRIARDLHDSIKQQIFAVSMQLGAALSLLEQKPDVAQQRVLEADTLTYHIQQELTTLIQELRPLAIQDKGLPAALQEYVTMWSQKLDIAADLYISDPCVFPPEVEEALWRVAQEALSNVARHSQASNAQISLMCEHGNGSLSVVDNGRGFDMAAVNTSGVGLHSIQERMEALGGTATIQSKVGEGTHILAQCTLASTHPDDSCQDAQETLRGQLQKEAEEV